MDFIAPLRHYAAERPLLGVTRLDVAYHSFSRSVKKVAKSVAQIEQCFAIDGYAVGRRGGKTTSGKFLGAGRLVAIDFVPRGSS